jgi:hypothetical protein
MPKEAQGPWLDLHQSCQSRVPKWPQQGLQTGLRGCGIHLGFLYMVLGQKSSILLVWAAPADPKTIPQGGVFRPPPSGMVGAAQTHKIDDSRQAQKPCQKRKSTGLQHNANRAGPLPRVDKCQVWPIPHLATKRLRPQNDLATWPKKHLAKKRHRDQFGKWSTRGKQPEAPRNRSRSQRGF